MDAILGAFNNPVVLTFLVAAWGMLLRFAPAFAKIPGNLIPLLSAVLALLVKLAAPGDANAQGGDTLAATAGLDTLAVLALGGAKVSFWSKLAAAIGQALLNALLYDKFLKAPAEARFEPAKKRRHA